MFQSREFVIILVIELVELTYKHHCNSQREAFMNSYDEARKNLT